MSNFKELYSNIFLNNKLYDYNTQELSEKFERFSQILVAENAKYNLTAVKNDELIVPLHFADSLLGAEYIPMGARVLDVGSGAGFPALPFAIARKDVSVTALDSTAKKMAFAESVARELGVEGFLAVSGRAEELARDSTYREKYSFVCARAVARLNILSELCLPFVSVGGYFLAMKGAVGEEEYAEAKRGIEVLGGRLELLEEKALYVSENESQKRTFVLIRKAFETPVGYPRMYSKILKKPL